MQITKSELQSNEEQDIWIENLQGMFVLLMIFRLYQSPSPALQKKKSVSPFCVCVCVCEGGGD